MPAAIDIFINRRRIGVPGGAMTADQILRAGDYGGDYELFLLNGEGDPAGGRRLAPTEVVEVRPGMQFRAIPRNPTFGFSGEPAVAFNELLDEDLGRLRDQGFDYEILCSGPEVGIVVREVPLPEGVFSKPATNMMLKTTTLYPQSEMDMFWVDPDLVLVSGAEPVATNLEVHFGRTWRRFSWHRNCPWVPGRDDLLTHLEFARARLAATVSYLATDGRSAHDLAARLLAATPLESGTFATLRALKRGDVVRLVMGGAIETGVEWESVGEDALTPSGSMISVAVSAAQERRCGLAFVHTHPFDPAVPSLSSIDRETTARLSKVFVDLLDGPFASLVVSPGGWAGVLQRGSQQIELERICLVDRRLELHNGAEGSLESLLDDRQRRALGPAANRVLRALHVGIVGVGGIGAPLAETLARMGIRKLTLVDNDVLEPSNVRRVFGVGLDAAEAHRPKARAVAAGLRRLGTGTTFDPVRGDVREASVQARLLDCDVIFGATDTHSSRAALAELCVRGCVPLIDQGARVGIRGDVLDALLFERRIQLPEGPCLWCWGTLDAHQVRLELMSEFEREGLQAEGYVAGRPGEPEPSVAALTVAAAATGAAALLALVSGGLEEAPLGTSFELVRGEAYPLSLQTPDPECVCARWRPV